MKLITKKIIQLNVVKTDKVESIKLKIQEQEDVSVHCIIFNDVALNFNRIISSYDITKSDVLRVERFKNHRIRKNKSGFNEKRELAKQKEKKKQKTELKFMSRDK